MRWRLRGRRRDRHGAQPPGRGGAQNQAFVDLMIPVVKGWSPRGLEIDLHRRYPGPRRHGLSSRRPARPSTSATPHHHDLRGTTAIQANDLIGRKIARENGQTVKGGDAEMRQVEASLAGGCW